MRVSSILVLSMAVIFRCIESSKRSGKDWVSQSSKSSKVTADHAAASSRVQDPREYPYGDVSGYPTFMPSSSAAHVEQHHQLQQTPHEPSGTFENHWNSPAPGNYANLNAHGFTSLSHQMSSLHSSHGGVSGHYTSSPSNPAVESSQFHQSASSSHYASGPLARINTKGKSSDRDRESVHPLTTSRLRMSEHRTHDANEMAQQALNLDSWHGNMPEIPQNYRHGTRPMPQIPAYNPHNIFPDPVTNDKDMDYSLFMHSAPGIQNFPVRHASHDMQPYPDMCHAMPSAHDISSAHGMSSAHAMSSAHVMPAAVAGQSLHSRPANSACELPLTMILGMTIKELLYERFLPIHNPNEKLVIQLYEFTSSSGIYLQVRNKILETPLTGVQFLLAKVDGDALAMIQKSQRKYWVLRALHSHQGFKGVRSKINVYNHKISDLGLQEEMDTPARTDCPINENFIRETADVPTVLAYHVHPYLLDQPPYSELFGVELAELWLYRFIPFANPARELSLKLYTFEYQSGIHLKYDDGRKYAIPPTKRFVLSGVNGDAFAIVKKLENKRIVVSALFLNDFDEEGNDRAKVNIFTNDVSRMNRREAYDVPPAINDILTGMFDVRPPGMKPKPKRRS